jgi:DDE superfamily endonuclease
VSSQLIFFPPYAPELNPIERLWRDLKDELARDPPCTLDALSEQVADIIKRGIPPISYALSPASHTSWKLSPQLMYSYYEETVLAAFGSLVQPRGNL